MAVLPFTGNSDFYGLGIRIGFYLQWFANVLAPLLAPSELPGMRFTNALFIAAIFVALIISTAENVNELHVVEVYIILLLTFGYFTALVPIFVWRVLTRFNPYYDPWRWSKAAQGVVFDVLYFLLMIAVAAFQIWFWVVRVPTLDGLPYQEYGFLFTKVRLNETWFRWLNVAFYSVLLLSCLIFVLGRLVSSSKDKKWKAPRKKKQRIALLRNLSVLLNFLIASINVIAVELTIHWNRISGVNSLRTTGQLIPFFIGIGSLIRLLYVAFTQRFRRGGGDDGDLESSAGRFASRPTERDDEPMDPRSIPMFARQEVREEGNARSFPRVFGIQQTETTIRPRGEGVEAAIVRRSRRTRERRARNGSGGGGKREGRGSG